VQWLCIEVLTYCKNCGSFLSCFGELQDLAHAWEFNKNFDCYSRNGKVDMRGFENLAFDCLCV
jgi:hypothetical protein